MIKEKTRKQLERDPRLMVPIAFDDIFKVVFGSEENKDITAYLVSLLLKLPYEKVKGHVKFKEIRMLRGKKAVIEAQKPMWVQTDGEVKAQAKKISVSDLGEKVHFIY